MNGQGDEAVIVPTGAVASASAGAPLDTEGRMKTMEEEVLKKAK